MTVVIKRWFEFIHSYIYLKGITSSHLDNVVTFLYTGEVYMDRNEVDGFVATAEELDVKGVKSYFDWVYKDVSSISKRL